MLQCASSRAITPRSSRGREPLNEPGRGRNGDHSTAAPKRAPWSERRRRTPRAHAPAARGLQLA